MITSMKMEENNLKIPSIYLELKGKMVGSMRGKSMEPTLKEGDQVQVEPVEAEDIKVGDIVVFECNKVLGCHRILGRFKKDDKFYFWEKGDNSSSLGYISQDKVIGRVNYFVKNNKFRRPDFYLDKYIILFYASEAIMYPYIKLAASIKKYIFRGNKNILSHLLGNMVWKTYYFYFSLIKCIKFNACHRN